jgi:hypothetical protein
VRPTPLPETEELLRLVDEGAPYLSLRSVGQVQEGDQCWPLHVVSLGSQAADAPAIGLFGGVHGLERIGAEVVLAFLRSLVQRLPWDDTLHHLLAGLRLVFMPLVNPGGLWRGTRANPQGVDLMRNAPVDALAPVPWLVGGQRISASLPWYRGREGAAMEVESAALCRVVQDELLSRPFSLAVDCHSGFGLTDRIWFPYAHTARPIEHLPELHALAEVMDRALLHHRYVFEPQSRMYLAHGDLWDHLYRQSRRLQPAPVFLPLTLEMGSWLWVRKNPRQMFSRHGIFNPLIAHRQQRVLRRHIAWLDLMSRLALGHAHWRPVGAAARALHHEQALTRWYRSPRSAAA